MGVRLGLKAVCYRNTGNYAVPVWVEVENIRDLTLSLEKSESDVTRRASAGWRELVGALKEGSLEFQSVWDDEDADLGIFLDSFLNHTAVEMLVLSGPIDEEGSQGLRASMEVFTCTRNENLEEAILADISIKPTYAANPPSWYVVELSE